MKITMISNNSFLNGEHLSKIAWKNSRPDDEDTPLKKILLIDAPVNEIPCATLAIECTILEREIFTSLRDHSLWAMTSRVSDPTVWDIPSSIYITKEQQKILDDHLKEMCSEKDKGVHQDLYRMHMPLCATTAFTTTINLRNLIKIYLFMYELATRNKSLYNHLLKSCSEILNILKLMTATDNLDEVLKRYSYVDFLPAIDSNFTGRSGDFVTITENVSIALRAQIVRHRNFQFTDDLIGIFLNEDVWTYPISTSIKIQLSAHNNIWKGIISKRSCWMTQYDIWGGIISKASNYIAIDESILPCKNTCPYNKDAELRYTNADPGSPCPKHAHIYNIPVTQQLILDMKSQLIKEPRPKFWDRIIDKIERRL